VSGRHLDVDREHTPAFARGKEPLQERAAEPLSPLGRADEEVIDEGVEAAEFHAVSDREHNIAGGLPTVEGDDGGAEGGIAEQRREAPGRPRSVERISALGVELLHQIDEEGDVIQGGVARGGHEPNLYRMAPSDATAPRGAYLRVQYFESSRPRYKCTL